MVRGNLDGSLFWRCRRGVSSCRDCGSDSRDSCCHVTTPYIFLIAWDNTITSPDQKPERNETPLSFKPPGCVEHILRFYISDVKVFRYCQDCRLAALLLFRGSRQHSKTTFTPDVLPWPRYPLSLGQFGLPSSGPLACQATESGHKRIYRQCLYRLYVLGNERIPTLSDPQPVSVLALFVYPPGPGKATTDEAEIEGMLAMYKMTGIFPSRDHLDSALGKIEARNPKVLACHHGSVITGQVPAYMEAIRDPGIIEVTEWNPMAGN